MVASSNLPEIAIAQCVGRFFQGSPRAAGHSESLWAGMLSLRAIIPELLFCYCNLKKKKQLFGIKLTGGLFVIYNSTQLVFTGNVPFSHLRLITTTRGLPPLWSNLLNITCVINNSMGNPELETTTSQDTFFWCWHDALQPSDSKTWRNGLYNHGILIYLTSYSNLICKYHHSTTVR